MIHIPTTSIMNKQATTTSTSTGGDCERPPLARTNAMKCNQIQYHPIVETVPIPRIFCPLKRDISDISIESILLTSSSLDDNNYLSAPTKYDHQYDRHAVHLTSDEQECIFHSSDDDDEVDVHGNSYGSNDAHLECTITGLSNIKHIQRPFQVQHQDIVPARPLRHCSRQRSSIIMDEKQKTVFVDHHMPEKVFYAPPPRRQNSLRDAISHSNMYAATTMMASMSATTSFHKVFFETQVDTIPTIPLRKRSFIEDK